ncbi:MAG: hypothetical protein ED859_10560 [Desulfuromonadales bacterium]|nr:MAG: hypothetical protein ED859_10560 [Desulfuromonadales bacterium]
MCALFSRIVALVMVLTLLCVFGGAGARSVLAAAPVAADSCCDRDSGRDAAPAGEEQAPCQSTECSCLSCLVIVAPPVVVVGHFPVAVLVRIPTVFTPHPSLFVASIDYPPEAA